MAQITTVLPCASRGSLYEFVRQTLAENGGSCTKVALLAAIQSDSHAAQRLQKGLGFGRLLVNMKHSGFIEMDGDIVRRTKRRVGRKQVLG